MDLLFLRPLHKEDMASAKISEAINTLTSDPEKFDLLKKQFSEPLETLLPLRVLTKISGNSDVKREINRRSKGLEKNIDNFRALCSNVKDPAFTEKFLKQAEVIDHQHGLGKEASPIGNALVHHVLIPLKNLKDGRTLEWTQSSAKHYHKIYSEAEGGKKHALDVQAFELTHPLDKARINVLETLNIRDQPNFDQVTSEFCGEELRSFCVSNCDLKSLPTNALANSKNLKFLNISGNQSLKQSEIEKTLTLMSEASSPLQHLDLSNLKLTKVPGAVKTFSHLETLKMDNCSIMSLSSDDFPPSLKELSIQGHQIEDIHSQLSPKGVFSKFRKLDISSGETKISSKQLFEWIDRGTTKASSSPMEYFAYSTKEKPSTFTQKQREFINSRLPNLKENGFHYINFN